MSRALGPAEPMFFMPYRARPEATLLVCNESGAPTRNLLPGIVAQTEADAVTVVRSLHEQLEPWLRPARNRGPHKQSAQNPEKPRDSCCRALHCRRQPEFAVCAAAAASAVPAGRAACLDPVETLREQ
jgi:hypothetical protein